VDHQFTPRHHETSTYKGLCACGSSLFIAEGSVIPSPQPQESDSTLNARGTTAIARSLPNASTFEFSTFMGETITGGLPRVPVKDWKKHTSTAKQAGGEYLNVEFGWLPFVSDLKSFARAVNDSHELWQNYRKGSDKTTRVGYAFPSGTTSGSWDGTMYAIPSRAGTGPGTMVWYQESSCWFKGAFRYYIPEPVGFAAKMQYYQSQASLLYGVRLTPDVVWNLAPWSWAADWFANTGDIISNVSHLGQDGLAMTYGYIMSQKLQTIHRVMNLDGLGVLQRDTQVKACRRLKATPYGFGLSWDGFSKTQLAVIAALGISRDR
jgi:hypothetical protein